MKENSNWSLPLPLTPETIVTNIEPSCIGNYRLARGLSPDGCLYVSYVGRSDSDVATRIANHLGEGYRYFRFCYQPSRKAAYEQECRDYHKYGGDKGHLDNQIHPDSPTFMNYKCPYC